MSSKIGVHNTTIRKYQDVLLKAVEWYQDKVNRERSSSAAANPDYEQLTQLRMGIQNATDVFDEAFRLLRHVVTERRDYLVEESQLIEVNLKKICDEIKKLEEFMDELN